MVSTTRQDVDDDDDDNVQKAFNVIFNYIQSRSDAVESKLETHSSTQRSLSPPPTPLPPPPPMSCDTSCMPMANIIPFLCRERRRMRRLRHVTHNGHVVTSTLDDAQKFVINVVHEFSGVSDVKQMTSLSVSGRIFDCRVVRCVTEPRTVREDGRCVAKRKQTY